MVTELFWALNGIELTATDEDSVIAWLKLAAGTVTEAALARWIQQNSAKRR